jgi:hypothetical protein
VSHDWCRGNKCRRRCGPCAEARGRGARKNRTPALGGPGSFAGWGEGIGGLGHAHPALGLMWLLTCGFQALRVARLRPPQCVANLHRPVTLPRVGTRLGRGRGAEGTSSTCAPLPVRNARPRSESRCAQPCGYRLKALPTIAELKRRDDFIWMGARSKSSKAPTNGKELIIVTSRSKRASERHGGRDGIITS